MSLILIGDFGQLPPVGDRPLFASDGKSTHGYMMYLLFKTVIILEQIVRQHGQGLEIVQFRELLMQLRNGQSTETDWATVLQRTPSSVSNVSDFDNAVHLFCMNADVAEHNIKSVLKLGFPVATINAIHSCHKASVAKCNEAGGLEPVIHLAKHAKVMLTANLWQQAGLCNGSVGHIEDFLYVEGQKPPNLPITVLVEFHDYNGPAFLTNNQKCIPIPLITFEWHDGTSPLSRQQLPLRLCYAMTIHKSQGQTLHKAVIDLGNKKWLLDALL